MIEAIRRLVRDLLLVCVEPLVFLAVFVVTTLLTMLLLELGGF